MSSWGVLGCTSVLGDGSMTLSVTTSAFADPPTRATATWTDHTNNSTIKLGLGNFIGYRVLLGGFNVFYSSSIPILQDCTLEWQEGTTRPPTASAVYKDRYIMSYTSSTLAGAYNDHQLIVDRNDKFTLFSGINCLSLNVYQRKLHCGSSQDNGFAYILDTGTDDDGSSFRSIIRTKAFNLGLPAHRKLFKDLYLDLEPEPNSSDNITLTSGYRLDRGTYTTTLSTVDLGEDPDTILTPRFPFTYSLSSAGRYIAIELSSTGLNQPWRLFGGRLYYRKLRRE